MSRRPRVFHPGAQAPGQRLRLSREESHHLARVLRARVGDPVWVFDGRGGEWAGTIVASSREGVEVELGRARVGAIEPALPVVLYASLCPPERMAWLVQKSVELGVAAVRCVAAARSKVPRPSAARLERWRRIALEACKQCGRRSVPDVALAPGWPPEIPGGVRALWCATDPQAPPLGERLRHGEPPQAAWLAIGPEGGFAEEEETRLARAGWEPVSLGPRILRTETAAVVACALVLHHWGDLGRSS